MSKELKLFKGPWLQRLAIIFLSIVLAVLLFWLLGFLTKDIGSLPGPDFSAVMAKYVEPDLVQERKSLEENLRDIRENIRNKQERQGILKDSTSSLQNTINQLLSIQKQNIERNLALSPEQQQTLTDSQSLFLENQKQYQLLSTEIAALTGDQRRLEKELASVLEQINTRSNSGRTEYEKLMSSHRWKIAALKLSVMLPIFLVTAWFFMKKRSATYGPIVCAAFIAIFIRISLVVHEYFPRKYFKYIALLVVIGIVIKLLAYLVKRVVFPKKNSILKQYQEAYDKGDCPICAKPIRIAQLHYTVTAKRKVLVLAGQGGGEYKQEPYTCPSCGTRLYEKCDKCSNIRHNLLPFCRHCGAENPGWLGQVDAGS
jgi:predicted RNA-binding Zn-ribbon protein involved in translation (DUF1610 family)